MAESTDTSTTPAGTPTTNEELGVVGAKAANDLAARTDTGPIPPDDATLRLQGLQVAQMAGGSPSEVIARAKAYTDYLKDGSDDV